MNFNTILLLAIFWFLIGLAIQVVETRCTVEGGTLSNGYTTILIWHYQPCELTETEQ